MSIPLNHRTQRSREMDSLIFIRRAGVALLTPPGIIIVIKEFLIVHEYNGSKPTGYGIAN
jgi:hypothetical protein